MRKNAYLWSKGLKATFQLSSAASLNFGGGLKRVYKGTEKD